MPIIGKQQKGCASQFEKKNNVFREILNDILVSSFSRKKKLLFSLINLLRIITCSQRHDVANLFSFLCL